MHARVVDECRVCGNRDGNREFAAREMMLGFRDEFTYVECGRCGCLQIRDIPEDLSRFYPEGYYSFKPPKPTSWLSRVVRRRLGRRLGAPRDWLRTLLGRFGTVAEPIIWADRAGIGLDAAVLDVGAGVGRVLLEMRDFGFSNLLGADPYIERDLDYPGVRLRRRHLEDVSGQFDLVMFNHSFEHVEDPHATLAAAAERLNEGGTILIRTPVAAQTWREYGSDWVELDAPRHLHVHTARSIDALAAAHGLEVYDVRYESIPFEIWGSELYRLDIHLYGKWLDEERSKPLFTKPKMRRYRARAAELNRTGEAGRAAFWLRKRRTVD